MMPRLIPRSIEGQMSAVLAASFVLLLVLLAVLEYFEQNSVTGWAGSEFTLNRLARMKPLVESLPEEGSAEFIERASRCHDGYTLTGAPFPGARSTGETQRLSSELAHSLRLDPSTVQVGHARLGVNDFAYASCGASEMKLPFDGLVISVRTASGQWLNAEVHPHEWHLTPNMTGWLLRSGAAFLLVGAVALIFVRRLSKPIKRLTEAAKAFGTGLEVAEIPETGPPDVRRAIRSFNAMQRQVAGEVKRRTNTLAAIGHDVRSPLTALRLKAELIEDESARADFIASIEKMERMTTSALEFLKGESRSEPKKQIDLCALVESECADFAEVGASVAFASDGPVHYRGRPDALSRAVRNLIENAVKYASHADVSVRRTESHVEIVVCDTGPGIPADKLDLVLEPFERLSFAREANAGGFGLGLAIARAVAEGHEGALVLAANVPCGLCVIVRLPAPAE